MDFIEIKSHTRKRRVKLVSRISLFLKLAILMQMTLILACQFFSISDVSATTHSELAQSFILGNATGLTILFLLYLIFGFLLATYYCYEIKSRDKLPSLIMMVISFSLFVQGFAAFSQGSEILLLKLLISGLGFAISFTLSYAYYTKFMNVIKRFAV